MDLSLKDKVAVISGGASGIGAETARSFLSLGAKVIIGDIDKTKGKAFLKQLKIAGFTEIEFHHLDVTQEQSWAEVFDFARSKFGRLTTLVNSAGVSIPGNIEDISLAE
jgi:NAD(P)-dependent dehydrogenase (short-subunit alcohol dehydrogenase family)